MNWIQEVNPINNIAIIGNSCGNPNSLYFLGTDNKKNERIPGKFIYGSNSNSGCNNCI